MRNTQHGSRAGGGGERAESGPLFHRARPVGFGFSDDALDGAVEEVLEPSQSSGGGGDQGDVTIPAVLDDGCSEALSGRAQVPHAFMEVQQFLATQVSQVNRRVADVYDMHERRSHEDRKETYILVFALSVVLVFCFAAFFMHQMEVRDLHSNLEDEIERQEGHTRFELQEKIDTLGSKQLPELLALLDARLSTLEQSEQSARQALGVAVSDEGKRSRRQVSEMLLLLEDRLDRMQREMHAIRQLQIEGRSGTKASSRAAKAPLRGDAIPPVSAVLPEKDPL